MASRTDLISWMKAAGEPSRLRLLALCSEQEFAVTELARTLRQSGPRVSRHLKILCEAGLLERVRQGQWVHYRLPQDSAAAKFVRDLLLQLDRDDEVLERDRLKARGAAKAPIPAAPAGSRLGRTLRSFVESHKPSGRARSALVLGVRHLELLEAASAVAVQSTAVTSSRRAAQAARTFADEHGLPCKVSVSQSETQPIGAADGAHEAVIIEYAGGPNAKLEPLIEAARNAVSENGHVWLFARYDALESVRGAAGEHPLARLRRLLADAGLTCQHLSPIEADGEHVLAVVAIPSTPNDIASAKRRDAKGLV